MTVFKSKYRKHRIVLKPTKIVRVGDSFETKKGLAVQFEDYLYQTDDKDVIKILTEFANKFEIKKLTEKELSAEIKQKKASVK